jgi:hypothetical protein
MKHGTTTFESGPGIGVSRLGEESGEENGDLGFAGVGHGVWL